MRVGPRRGESAGGLREWADGVPGPAVRGRVRAYTGYREESPTPADRWEAPAGELILIVGFGAESRAQPEAGVGEPQAYTSFFAGMNDRPTRIAHDGHQFGMQIRLDPLGAYALFGPPMHELANRTVELSDLLGADAERWAGRLSEAPGWGERFALLDRLLAARMAAGPVPSPEVAWAWRTMRRAGGAVRVADLVTGAGCTHRHLLARFRDQVGTAPKTAARVLRFERAARLLARGEPAPAQVAAVCGYADQSHLTRDFARFAATTPAAVRRAAP
ncbi:helix-turn-helix domain-containing protein [Actinoallomurus bryophytorum]|uniref:AraC family transcriptional regulator n=1 Tax=Actinoallomurus bryophytorum TaxID=1490222 RepID=A0A543CGL3_9ACTN|nr:helix-turn-helix domain-containing protein [Actinoallomurus bryophytorum]TQL96233.1 AraC family transcriptional regulator [Actinoallomurus bryophytorum]